MPKDKKKKAEKEESIIEPELDLDDEDGEEVDGDDDGGLKINGTQVDVDVDLSINKFQLDKECVSHASLFYRYSEAAVMAKQRVGELSDALKLTTAEQNIKIRNDFIAQGTKFTESVIEAELTKDKKVQRAKSELREAEKVYALLGTAVSAFDHRRSELDNLVRLYQAGYWAQPSGEKSTVTEQVQTGQRRALNKKRT
jgi:hypothetical protein